MAHELKGSDPAYRAAEYDSRAMSPAEALRFSVASRALINQGLGKNRLPDNFVKSWVLARKNV